MQNIAIKTDFSGDGIKLQKNIVTLLSSSTQLISKYFKEVMSMENVIRKLRKVCV